MDPIDERGTGRTTYQMLDAPQGSVYIWPNTRSIWYARRLAQHLDRPDLLVYSIDWIRFGDWRMKRYPYIVLDHAVLPMTYQDHLMYKEALLHGVK